MIVPLSSQALRVAPIAQSLVQQMAPSLSSIAAVTGSSSFVSMLQSLGGEVVSTMRKGDKTMRQAVLGAVDPQKVAFDVMNMNYAVKQFVAIEKACVGAFKEVMHMSL